MYSLFLEISNDFAESLLTRGLSPLPVWVLDNQQLIREIGLKQAQLKRRFLFEKNSQFFVVQASCLLTVKNRHLTR
jgi:hypothetical protein